MKKLVLRITMIAALVAGAGIYAHPVQINSCNSGVSCYTKSGSQGVCRGCVCAGQDGTFNTDLPDCSFE
jgi:hypothetical protein